MRLVLENSTALVRAATVQTQPAAVMRSDLVSNFNVPSTVSYLKEMGFGSYAEHFKAQQYNGLVLIAVDKEDVQAMPEKDKLKQKAFLNLIAKLSWQLQFLFWAQIDFVTEPNVLVVL